MSTKPNIDLIMNTTVGVEIEMTGITRENAARVAATVLNGTVVHVGGCYDKWVCTDERGRKWSFVYDSSIEDPNSSARSAIRRPMACELNTPPITYAEDMGKLQELIRALRTAGAVSGPQYGCGIHVHVSGKGAQR